MKHISGIHQNRLVDLNTDITNNSHTLATFICAFQSEPQQERRVLSWKLLVPFVSYYINLNIDYLIR